MIDNYFIVLCYNENELKNKNFESLFNYSIYFGDLNES